MPAMKATVMSGPHQGQSWNITPSPDIEFRAPHPTEPGTLCRYAIRNGEGLPDAVHLHYLGDAPAQP